MTEEVRLLHLEPGYFGDVENERAVLSRSFDSVRIYEHKGNLAELVADPVRADIVATFGTPIDHELLEATGASVVAVYATGVDMVDLEAATELSVTVTRVPEYCDREVGEHALSLALALLRGLPQYEAETSRGGWD